MDESYVKQDFAQAQDHLFATRACIISHNVLRQTGGGQQEQPTRALRASIQALCAVQGPLDRALSQQAEIYQVPFSGTVEIRGTVAEESCSDLGGGGGGGARTATTHTRRKRLHLSFSKGKESILPLKAPPTHPPTNERLLSFPFLLSFVVSRFFFPQSLSSSTVVRERGGHSDLATWVGGWGQVSPWV